MMQVYTTQPASLGHITHDSIFEFLCFQLSKNLGKVFSYIFTQWYETEHHGSK